MAGYAVVVLLLAGGMTFATRRLEAPPDRHIAHIRAKEGEITLAERLRWNGAVLVSAGRGYVLSGDHELLTDLRETEVSFDETARELKSSVLTPGTASLVARGRETARCGHRHARPSLRDRAPAAKT